MITKKGRGLNEAMFLDGHKDMMEMIAIRFEEFTDDILPAILGRENGFRIRYRTIDDVLKVEWEWIDTSFSRIEEIRYDPCTEGEQVFINKVAAYLYGLLVFITNQ